MKESSLVKNIIAAVRQKYPRAYVRKLADRFSRGLPDILIIYRVLLSEPLGLTDTHALLIETKTQSGRLSKIQEVEHQAIRAAGGTVLVARDVQTVLYFLEGIGAVS